MFSSTKRSGVAVILGLALLALSALEARAQRANPNYQVRPGLTLRQAAFNIATIGQAFSNVPPYALGFNPYVRAAVYGGGPSFGNQAAGGLANPYASLYANPYGLGAGYGAGYDASGYGNPYLSSYYDPYYGYLRGGADVINSQGKFLMSTQQAYLTREQVRSERLANQRKVFDEYLYEREKTPTPEDERQRSMLANLNRSRNNPPVTEVWSGKALNDLLADLRKLPPPKPEAGQLINVQQLPLDEDGLKHINVTTGTGNVALLKNNLALLKSQGRLNWPAALSGAEYKDQREMINRMATRAVQQAEFGPVDSGTTAQLSNDVDNLQRQLRKNAGDLPFSVYTESKAFLNNLDDAITALRQRNVGDYFTGKYVLKAKTVPELVAQMTKQGLQFAPATPGDESAYTALHQALANYDLAAHAETASRQ